jgi:1-pyrroline-5-carboxylate dehydrogenase
VGETGGKDFVFAHASADPVEVATALVRGAFEYQGQKCSAASRAYLPRSLWPAVREHLTAQLARVTMGDVRDFSHFMNAVIDAASYRNLTGAVSRAKADAGNRVIFGGGASDAVGWFVEPTVVEVSDPRSFLMQEEFFGPLLSVFVYEDAAYEDTLALCDATSPYGLTGAVFSRDRYAFVKACQVLRYAAGNFYLNDKPTGAMVGLQPFGGARGSGTNDKAGGPFNLTRWISPRTIKETFVPATTFEYPFMQ